MAQIDLQITVDSTAQADILDIITNLNNDLGTLEDRLSRLSEQNADLQLKVEKGEIVATVKEA